MRATSRSLALQRRKGGRALRTGEHLRENRRFAQYVPVMPRTRLLKSGRILFPATLFCLSNEISREIWRPGPAGAARGAGRIRSHGTELRGRSSLDIPLADSSAHRILSSSCRCPRPPRAFLLLSSFYSRSAAELRDLERAAARTHVRAFFVITSASGRRESLFTPSRNLHLVAVSRREILHPQSCIV